LASPARGPDVTHSGAVEHVRGIHSWGDGRPSQSSRSPGTETVQIGRVTDAIILGRTAKCLLSASGSTVPRQTILRRNCSTAQVPEGCPQTRGLRCG
jgi:hypothetical protein